MQTIENFIESGDSRETSTEIMQAIARVATGNPELAERIWSDPEETEMIAICEIVTNNGLRSADDFCWGDSGNKWAVDIEQN